MTSLQFVSGVLIIGMLAAPGAAGAAPQRAEECGLRGQLQRRRDADSRACDGIGRAV